jgi:glycosyltransferase involved in cell wall biosynthesis
MKFIIIGPIYPYRGGIANYTRQLASGCDAAGFDVRVVSFVEQYPRFLYPGRSDIDPSPSPEALPDIDFALSPLLPRTWRDVARDLIRSQPDLVCINWWTPFWALPFGFLIRACEKAGIKSVVIVHNVRAHEKFFLNGLLNRFTLRLGSRFLVHSEIEAEKLRRLIRQQSKLVVHPLPPFDHYKSQEGDDLRRSLGLGPDDKVLLFFGLIRAYKGLSLLIEALAILRHRNIRPHLVIAGEFWVPKQSYVDQISRFGLESQVSIQDGYVAEHRVGALFQGADVLVAPHTRGTQSGSVALAQGFGLPIVASASIASGITMTENYPLSVFQTGNALDLARAIETQLHANRKDMPMPITDYWADLAHSLAEI